MLIRTVIAVVVIALAAGCAGDGQKKEVTQKQAGQLQWNTARAAVLYNLGRQQYEAGNMDDCRKTLDEAVVLAPENVAVRLLSAKLGIEQGKLEAAAQELERAKQLDAKNPEADYLLGVIYQRWQRPEMALDCYTRSTEHAPAELAYLLAKAEMLVALDRRGEALEILQEKVTYFENSPAIRDAVGQLLVQEGKYQQAVSLLRQASILAPDEANLREHLALALCYAGEWREGALLLGKIVKDERFSSRGDLLTALGECQLQMNLPRDARDSFDAAAQLQPGSTTAWLNLAKAALQFNDTRRAEISLKKAMSLEPNNFEANVMLGYLRVRQEQWDGALAAFRKASALDAKDPLSVCMSGYVLEKLGKSNEAIACYAAALKLKPGDELASTLMAQARLDD